MVFFNLKNCIETDTPVGEGLCSSREMTSSGLKRIYRTEIVAFGSSSVPDQCGLRLLETMGNVKGCRP